MTVFVMHFAGQQPAGYFRFSPDGTTPPWAFNGYARMDATNEEDAALEFAAAEAAFSLHDCAKESKGDKLKDKWKGFAVGQYFSGDLENENLIFDALMETSSEEEFGAVLEKFDIEVWEPFENYYYDQLVSALYDCAMNAQVTEARGDK